MYQVAAVYKFLALEDLPRLQEELRGQFAELGLCGSLLLAPEGINGTLAGPIEEVEGDALKGEDSAAISGLRKVLFEKFGVVAEDIKFSTAPEKPFNKLKVRLKKEIITFKQEHIDPVGNAGQYVAAKDWNELIEQPDVIVLDTRNKYETMIGTFKDALDPQIENFSEFAAYVRDNLEAHKDKKIAMFCTGGIRCEKASAFMKAEGFPEVYHLKGGILKYLEDVPAAQSLWQGECYVFDRRMSVGHGLATGKHQMCFCCGYPLTAEDYNHPLFEVGVSCRYCHAQTSQMDKSRYRERQRQLTKI